MNPAESFTTTSKPHALAVGQAVFLTLTALLLLAPLYRSGKAPLAVYGLELLAMVGIVVLAWSGRDNRYALTGIEKGLMVALLALPLLHLIPVPVDSRLWLPGQVDYYTAQIAAGASGLTTLSLNNQSTVKALLLLLVPVAVFWMTRTLPAAQLRRLVGYLLIMAGVEATIGLIQYGLAADTGSLWHFGLPPSGQAAVGTWTSRNNFAGFLNQALMLALALFMATLGRHRARVGDESLRERLVYFSTWEGHRAFVYAFIALLVFLAVIFTRSRMGIMTCMVGFVAATIAYSPRIGGDNVYGLTGTVIAVVLATAVVIGLGPVLARFSLMDPVQDGRSLIFAGTIEGIAHFFPLGSGIGTYVDVFPRFQDLSQAGYTINRAHNSYLEWLFTGGLPAGLLIAGFLYAYIRQWFLLGQAWGEFRFIQTGAGIGIGLTLLHDTVDYNLFVPANIVVTAFLAGLFFHPHRDVPSEPQRQTRRRPESAPLAATRLPAPVGDGSNPFDD